MLAFAIIGDVIGIVVSIIVAVIIFNEWKNIGMTRVMIAVFVWAVLSYAYLFVASDKLLC